MNNIGFFGITANPPHIGHCSAISQSLNFFDKIYVSLVYSHPFGKSFIEYEQRHKMLNILLKEYFSHEQLKKIFVTSVEKNYVQSTGKTPYSYNILSLLKEKEPENKFKLIIGADNYKPQVWHKFFNYQGIEEDFGVHVIEDTGTHSTDIRERLKNPQLNKEFIIEQCGHGIYDYVIHHKLYIQ